MRVYCVLLRYQQVSDRTPGSIRPLSARLRLSSIDVLHVTYFDALSTWESFCVNESQLKIFNKPVSRTQEYRNNDCTDRFTFKPMKSHVQSLVEPDFLIHESKFRAARCHHHTVAKRHGVADPSICIFVPCSNYRMQSAGMFHVICKINALVSVSAVVNNFSDGNSMSFSFDRNMRMSGYDP